MIREVVLDEIVLEEIRKTVYYARSKTSEFVAYISKKSSGEVRKELNAKTSELARAESRIADLKALFKRLYEDNVLGRISDEQFRMLSSDYEDEQKTLNEKIPVLETEIERLKSECTNVQRFLDITEKYTDITELTPELLRTFVNKIVIYEREKKHDKNAPQQIDIYYRYIGSMCAVAEETKENDETESD